MALPIPSNCLIPWVTFRADFMFTLVFLFLLKCVAVMLCFLDFCTMSDLSCMNFTGSWKDPVVIFLESCFQPGRAKTKRLMVMLFFSWQIIVSIIMTFGTQTSQSQFSKATGKLCHTQNSSTPKKLSLRKHILIIIKAVGTYRGSNVNKTTTDRRSVFRHM